MHFDTYFGNFINFISDQIITLLDSCLHKEVIKHYPTFGPRNVPNPRRGIDNPLFSVIYACCIVLASIAVVQFSYIQLNKPHKHFTRMSHKYMCFVNTIRFH